MTLSGSSHWIRDSNNGNFLGLIELLSRWDPILQEHVQNVKAHQGKGERLQVKYLSPESKTNLFQHVPAVLNNEFIAVIVDASPNPSHVEKTTFLIRY